MRKSLRRASLSLSINAVVILVLAIAMLGLGLGFTKKMFAKFGDTLTIPEPEMTATDSDPIVLTSNTVAMQVGKTTNFPIKYYHSGTTGPIFPHIDCGDDIAATGTDPAIVMKTAGISQTMNQGEQKTYRMLIEGSMLDDKDNKICTLSMCSGTSSDTTTACDTVVKSMQITLSKGG